jgi:hypothetical protein
MLITKRQNITQFCSEIPYESFPLTFKHALEVTRSLGIQYLWIDSLCIIQDDIQDWELEAARMGDIYENAYATIFAERASNCNDGLFQTAEDKHILAKWVREIAYQDPNTKEQHGILVSLQPAHYSDSLEEAFCLVDKPPSHLQNRGWVLQEEILSRRKICFSGSELHWQCRTMSQCECGLKAHTDEWFSGQFTWNLLSTLLRKDGSMTRGLSVNSRRLEPKSHSLSTSWKKLVELYSQRDFTNGRDRLSALAGAASRLSRPPQNYLAGIWLEDASDQLLWHGVNSNGSTCYRHAPYYAPSWSWASVQGRISFATFPPKTATQRWKVLHGRCIASGENPMGSVSAGILGIQAKVAPVFVQEYEGPGPILDPDQLSQHPICERRRQGKTYHLKLRADTGGGREPKSSLPDSFVFLDAEDDWDLFANKKSERLYYIIAQTGSAKGYVYAETNTYTMGLLIRESTSQPGHWERICLLSPQGRWRDWCSISEDREITLI